LRPAAQVREPRDCVIAGALKRLEEAGGFFLVKNNCRQTGRRLLSLGAAAPDFGSMRSRALLRFHELMIVRGQGERVPVQRVSFKT